MIFIILWWAAHPSLSCIHKFKNRAPEPERRNWLFWLEDSEIRLKFRRSRNSM